MVEFLELENRQFLAMMFSEFRNFRNKGQTDSGSNRNFDNGGITAVSLSFINAVY